MTGISFMSLKTIWIIDGRNQNSHAVARRRGKLRNIHNALETIGGKR
jgi:hypothetical protein